VFPPLDGSYTCTAKRRGGSRIVCRDFLGTDKDIAHKVHPLHREAMAPKAELKRWCPIREDTEDYLKKIFEEVRTFGAACGSLAPFRGRSAAISTSKGRHEAH